MISTTETLPEKIEIILNAYKLVQYDLYYFIYLNLPI